MFEDLVLVGMYVGATMIILAVCSLLADLVLPRCKRLNHWIDSLPLMQNNDPE